MSDHRPSIRKVQAALSERGFDFTIRELDRSTRTAAEAAAAVGCAAGQIAKSIVFRTRVSGSPVLVIASGNNRVDEAALARLVGEPVERADAGFVREQTGFAIGGVPPVGHDRPLMTYIDEDLLSFSEIWAAAGSPSSVFRLPSRAMVTMTGGTVGAVALQGG